VIFFLGLGAAGLLVAAAQRPWQLAAALTVMGAFAAIYHPVGIPMIVQNSTRPGFTIGLNGGLLFNIRSTFKGDMLDTTLVPMSQTAKAPASQIRTNWGLGLYAGVSFVKPVSPVLDLFAEPWYRVYLKNVATDDAPFQQKMSAWGLQLGIRYKFNNGGQRY